MRFIVTFVTAVCVLLLIKLRWPKRKNFYKKDLIAGEPWRGSCLFFVIGRRRQNLSDVRLETCAVSSVFISGDRAEKRLRMRETLAPKSDFVVCSW